MTGGAVAGGEAPRFRVLMVASELAPFAYTGGLGDVAFGLSSALARMGCDVLLVTPRYGVTRLPPVLRWWATPVVARVGWAQGDVRTLGVIESAVPAGEGAFRVCFLDHPHLFARDGVYGDAHGTFGDNDVRFAALCRGALHVSERVWPGSDGDVAGPDVIHAHDWHAALAIIYARLTMGEAWAEVPAVFTIHNLAFQGVFAPDVLDRLALPRDAFEGASRSASPAGVLAHEGQVNLLQGALCLADRVTTVSPSYAREILGPRDGWGLDGVLRLRRDKLSGIVNGIDESRFDPRTDPALAVRYDADGALFAKGAEKRAIASELGLMDDDGPLFGSVGRLTAQKGVDVLLEVIPGLVERGARFILVGTGEQSLEQQLLHCSARFPGRVATRIVFDASLARRVYAAADFFVVPSRYEPCGLTQLYAMRYGALPIVTPVGGLRDTVTPLSSLADVGTGLVAGAITSEALLIACEDALSIYRDRTAHRAAVRRAMARDSSWRVPAREYRALYDIVRR